MRVSKYGVKRLAIIFLQFFNNILKFLSIMNALLLPARGSEDNSDVTVGVTKALPQVRPFLLLYVTRDCDPCFPSKESPLAQLGVRICEKAVSYHEAAGSRDLSGVQG